MQRVPDRPIAKCALILVTLLSGIHCGTMPQPGGGEPSPGGRALMELQAQSATKPFLNIQRGVPVFVEAEVPVPNYAPDNPVTSALSFFAKYKDFYRFEEPASQLYLKRIFKDDAGDHLFFGQQR